MLIISSPLDALIPLDTIAGLAVANVIAVITLLVLCFLAGLATKSLYVKRIQESIDSKMKILIPDTR